MQGGIELNERSIDAYKTEYIHYALHHIINSST